MILWQATKRVRIGERHEEKPPHLVADHTVCSDQHCDLPIRCQSVPAIEARTKRSHMENTLFWGVAINRPMGVYGDKQ